MIAAPTLAEVEAARERLGGAVPPNPVVRFDDTESEHELFLALENLSPIGSFKLRGAGNALLSLGADELAAGVVTASAGNMAQGVAWHARALGVPARVVAPDTAPRAKLDRIRALGATTLEVPFERWWQVLEEGGHPEVPGQFVHPVADERVMAGNGTLALDLLEALGPVDAVLVPFGGGGLACGIAAVLRERTPDTQVFACEVDSAAPFAAALEAGGPVGIEHRPSFVDGIGAGSVLPEMWPLASELLAGSLVVSLDEVAEALRRIAHGSRTIAEGAGAVALAAARAGVPGLAPGARVACVVSGGNIDADVLAAVLRGETPRA